MLGVTGGVLQPREAGLGVGQGCGEGGAKWHRVGAEPGSDLGSWWPLPIGPLVRPRGDLAAPRATEIAACA